MQRRQQVSLPQVAPTRGDACRINPDTRCRTCPVCARVGDPIRVSAEASRTAMPFIRRPRTNRRLGPSPTAALTSSTAPSASGLALAARTRICRVVIARLGSWPSSWPALERETFGQRGGRGSTPTPAPATPRHSTQSSTIARKSPSRAPAMPRSSSSTLEPDHSGQWLLPCSR